MNETKLGLNDILALDRTRLAAERTLMGWVRTSFSMMTFGFTIYKVVQEIGQLNATTGATRPEAQLRSAFRNMRMSSERLPACVFFITLAR